MCYQCIQHSSKIQMYTWYHRSCATIHAEMQWIHTSQQVCLPTKRPNQQLVSYGKINFVSFFTDYWIGFPEIIVCLILRDILLGLEYIHRKSYIHRSIRASHILINQTKAVLCGFREPVTLITNGQRTQKLYDLPSNSVKSLNWLAPEVLEQNLAGYTEKSDIYSIGITTCELANGLEPFANMPTTFMLTEKMRGNQPVLFDCSTCPDEIFGEW